jgi:general secretion pathway protein G
MKREKIIEKRCSSQSGFTLIEVLVGVAILGILAGVVVGNFSGKGKGARIKATRTSIAAICTAIDMYEVDTGRFPPNLDGLVKSDGAANWSGPYLRGGVPMDSWGTPFSYTTESTSYKVTSGGPDGSIGGADDITN